MKLPTTADKLDDRDREAADRALAAFRKFQEDKVAQPLPMGGMMVDLNTATAEELDAIAQLKGHGFEIVRYREERGRFTSLRQLDEVPGLAAKTNGLEAQLTTG